MVSYIIDEYHGGFMSHKRTRLVTGGGRIRIEKCVTFGTAQSPGYYSGYAYIEARFDDSFISIGRGCQFNNNISIIAEHGLIEIGEYCLFGWGVSIINSDFHPIGMRKRADGKGSGKVKNIKIGDNVFIGNNVSILKGVHIGDNAVIASCSVVFEDVKANTIVRGNPATFYKEIYE